MQKTTNYGFNKPESTDFYNVEDFNQNAEIIDGKLKEFEDGTTPVGNANKLGGKDASEYVSVVVLNEPILEKVKTLADGLYEYKLGGYGYTGSDLPHRNYAWGYATVYVHSNAYREVVLHGYGSLRPVYNHFIDGAWLGWTENATTADLANYLPKSGGDLSGVVTQTTKGDYASYRLKNNTGTIDIEFMLHGQMGSGIFNNLNNKWVLRTNLDGTSVFNGTATGNLPLSGGGRVIKDGASPLELESTSATSVWESFYSTLGYLGRLGFSAKETPAFMTTGGGVKELLHTGNKPTGTYTGSGSNAYREINIGGLYNSHNGSGLLYVCNTGDGTEAIVSPNGARCLKSDGTVTTLSTAVCGFNNGKLVIAIDSIYLNKSGATYSYQLL